jgi:hypothetical protein
MKMALAVITYDRAHYLSLVLPSILAQTIDGRPIQEDFDIHVFQDGFCHDDSRSNADGHRQVSEIMFGLPAYIEKFQQPENLGVALHFDFIEKLLFREKNYDFVLFCEDDLILSSQYASIIKKMAEKFARDERVGMISAHPSNPTRSKNDQLANSQNFTGIGHNWGFGLFREFWERRQYFIELYLNIVKTVPYRNRNENYIFKWLELCGFSPNASSQDYVKTCATTALGAVKLATYANLALPIGRNGLHCTSRLFDQMGFGGTVVCDHLIDEVGDLTDQRFQEILNAQQKACLPKAGSSFSRVKWERAVRNGALHPLKLVGEYEAHSQPKGQNDPKIFTWSSADIPRKPHMELEGLELLTSRLSESACFMEYGAGGSTILAGELGVSTVYSVESDRGFLDAVKGAVAETASGPTLIDHYVDIGPTAEWGNPKDSSKAANWPLYASSIWCRILEGGSAQPDLVLIDGRFRVACFLATLHFSKPGTTILFDDYHDRPNYHVVEKYLKPINRAGRMAEFRTEGVPPPEAMLDLMAHSTIYA